MKGGHALDICENWHRAILKQFSKALVMILLLRFERRRKPPHVDEPGICSSGKEIFESFEFAHLGGITQGAALVVILGVQICAAVC